MNNSFQYKDYCGSADFSLEDNLLFGKIMFIADTVTYEAETPAGLQTAFEEAVDDYIETCNKLGREPQKAFSGTFNVRVGPDLHKEAAVYASSENISLNVFIKSAIRQKLDKKINVVHNHIHTSQVIESRGFQIIKEEQIDIGSDEWQIAKIIQH